MKSAMISLGLFTGFLFVSMAGSSLAEEIVLCINETEKYIVKVNGKGDCGENENQMVLSGPSMGEKKSMTPVARFTSNEDCDGEGTKTEIGFDANENGVFDAIELLSITASCKPGA